MTSTGVNTLAARCTAAFSDAAKLRGSNYANSGRVTMIPDVAHGIRSVVLGSSGRSYVVALESSWAQFRGVLWVSCSCPNFFDGYLCKHLWATITMADREGLAAKIPGQGPLELIPENPEDESDAEGTENGSGGEPAPDVPVRVKKEAPLDWRRILEPVKRKPLHDRLPGAGSPAEIHYLANFYEMSRHGHLVLDFHEGTLREDGTLSVRPHALSLDVLRHRSEGPERDVLALLLGSQPEPESAAAFVPVNGRRFSRSVVLPPLYDLVVPRLCETGRFAWSRSEAGRLPVLQPLAWDSGPAWTFGVRATEDTEARAYRFEGYLTRGEETLKLLTPVMFLRDGLVFFEDRVARFDDRGAFDWLTTLRRNGVITIPYDDQDDLIRHLAEAPLEAVELPEALRLTTVHAEPVPRIALRRPNGDPEARALEATISFDYGGWVVPLSSSAPSHVDPPTRRIFVRDPTFETRALTRLEPVGFRAPNPQEDRAIDAVIPAAQLPNAARELFRAGWQVEAEGHVLKAMSESRFKVSSGVDWFEVTGRFDFGDSSATLPELLAAAQSKDGFVRLGDGSYGVLPEDWLARHLPFAEFGRAEDDGFRFVMSQSALLDALLDGEANVDRDAFFMEMQAKLRAFQGVEPRRAPAGFTGTLRTYQEEGLGWLNFLRDFRFGGCLADDMGLGKTVQVLALLEERRASGETPRLPSLVVAPRSVLRNWVEEAERFTPKLRVLDYSGLQRKDNVGSFSDYDVVVTTYGTLRRDVLALKDLEFDYVILDEAQAVKNPRSLASRACRLMKARHHLALSGTPIENHLGELWALFEFLNPGLLGGSSRFKSLAAGRGAPETAELLGRALRPFILRRTKEQVLRELPVKSEQTLHCELKGKQLAAYNELRDHYRASLGKKIDKDGIERSRFQVLEALLRLRQAACHPGLIDKSRINEKSAKLEVLWEQIQEVLDEGHKALVFSQFTSLLAIVRRKLDREKVVYEYLDGRTVKRSERVARFQTDPDCGLFLISLKAGGLGLNLTAADYVFILDPWWNPAVEAQAIDRAHRIGQTRPVFAYRLIARGTVEEKIVELQGTKRHLAEAIITADKSLAGSLTIEDVGLLLS